MLGLVLIPAKTGLSQAAILGVRYVRLALIPAIAGLSQAAILGVNAGLSGLSQAAILGLRL